MEPLFPPIPLDPAAPRRISPTDIAQYLRLDQCRRYLRLRLHERAHGRGDLERYGVAAQAIPPILTIAGGDYERRIEVQIAARYRGATHCRQRALQRDDEFTGPHHNQLLAERAAALAPGDQLLLFQPRLMAALGAWELRGDIDILRLERGADGALRALIVDSKSSAAAKVEHRLQIAFYQRLLERICADAGLPLAAVTLGVLYRGPAPETPQPPAEQARLAAERAAAAQELGVSEGYLELVADPTPYLAEVATLLSDPRSVAAEAAAAPFAAIPCHLTAKCDGCLYNELCMKWAAEHDDLSLIPFLSETEKGALRAGGVATTRELAALKELPATGDALVTPPARQAQVAALVAGRALGPRLDELIHRARRYRSAQGDPLRALGYIPYRGYGSLPACDATIHPNLVRVYLDAQLDYTRGHLYLLGALISACADGAEDPARRRAIIQLCPAPPERPEQERDLLVAWVGATLAALAALAAPDAEGQPRAPIHLIFFDATSQRCLLDALARHFGAVAGATPLYDLIAQSAGFESPTVTILDAERRARRNDPLICSSLQGLARARGFDWGQHQRTFYRRMFDERGRLDDGPAAGAWYTRRARFSSQIPLEYAYAAWGQLPARAAGRPDDFADYRAADEPAIRAFQQRRLEAIEHLAREMPPNRQSEKPPFDLSRIASFSQSARSLADALAEFLTLERHTFLAGWKNSRLPPPEQRALAGVSLPVRYELADQDPALLAMIAENERRAALRARYSDEFLAANPGRKRATLSPAQKRETAPLTLRDVRGALRDGRATGRDDLAILKDVQATDAADAADAAGKDDEAIRLRLRLDMADVDCDLASALRLTSLAPGDGVILAPRWSEDERLPPDQRTRFTTTARQILSQPRGTIGAIHPDGTVELEARLGGASGDRRYTFGYSWRWPQAGERYTLEVDPSDIYGQRCARVVEEIRLGAPNALYGRLTAGVAAADWPALAAAGQGRFAAGLAALADAGVLHGFDAHQLSYIAGHGAAATLIVQGPPGTGKSYATAFALLARMQGALAAGGSFRAMLTCKTHAATDVLLGKVAEVQALLENIRRQRPALFAAYFDPAILAAPRYRVRPREAIKPEAGTLGLGDGAGDRSTIAAAPACFVAATPFATSTLAKGGQPFIDCLVLDEASQMSLPEACMAAMPLRDGGQLIVVGDHRQMPPIVQHGWGDERRRTFQTYRAYSSLFETLIEQAPTPAAPPIVRLAESFRLHREIASFLRAAIYELDGIGYFSRLEHTLAAHDHADPLVAAALSPDHPLVVIVHDEAQSQVLNPFEIGLAAPILQALAGAHQLDAAHGIGVVVPHRAQRAALRAALPGMMAAIELDAAAGAAVDTVERFQGDEREAILICATESDPDYLRIAGEFLLDPRRLNVALSRARRKLILIASRSVFQVFAADDETFLHAQLWKRLLRDTCRDQLWAGARAGVAVEVWGSAPAAGA